MEAEPTITTREQLRNIVCSAIHRTLTGDWDGGEGQCPKCRLAADEAALAIATFVADWLQRLPISIIGTEPWQGIIDRWLLDMQDPRIAAMEPPSLDERIIADGGISDRSIPPWMRKYLPLFVVPEGYTADRLYGMPREESKRLGPLIGIACVGVENQVMLLSRMHDYGYLRDMGDPRDWA